MNSSVKKPATGKHTSANAVIIKCAGCQNIFRARPRDAVCLKCKRPANAPLPLPQKALSLVVFPWGLIQAARLRSSQPYAAGQAALLGIVGAVVWTGVFVLGRLT